MRQIQRVPSKNELVCESLRTAIVQGELAPCERLVIDELATRLGVSQIPVREALRQLEADGFVTIQPHIGATVTGIQPGLMTEIFGLLEAMEIILGTARRFAGLEFIDFGGGFGIPYRPDQETLPLPQLGAAMAERMAVFCKDYGRPVRMKLEPGRFLVAQSGTLLMRVTNRQATPAYQFVGTDSGFNHLARPVMYGAYHQILNASAASGEPEQVVVAGNICESGDVFTQNAHGVEARPVPRPEIGHLLALRDAGAYGMVLASNYNLRGRPAEVLVHNGQARLIRRRETFEDLTALYPDLG